MEGLLVLGEDVDDADEVETAFFYALDSSLTKLVDGHLASWHQRGVRVISLKGTLEVLVCIWDWRVILVGLIV